MTLAQRDQLELQGLRVPPGQPDLLVPQVPLEPLQLFPVQQAQLAPLDQQALIQLSLAPPGLQVQPDPPDLLGLQVQLGQQALIVMFPALLVLRDLQAIPVPLALPDLQARRVMLAPLAPLDLPDLKETLVLLDQLGLRVIRVFKVFRVQPGLPDQRGLRDLLGLKVILVLQDLLDPQAHKEMLDPPGLQVPRAIHLACFFTWQTLGPHLVIPVTVTFFGRMLLKQAQRISMSAT